MWKRENNRRPDQLRPVVMKAGVIEQANGSALVSLGRTTAIAAVYGPRQLFPKRLRLPNKALLQTVYQMVPFSTVERSRPGHSRRSMEICKVTRQALEPALFLEEFPRAVIDVYINIIQADAGTRTAGINAASIALADAGIPMRDLVVSIASGKIGNDTMLDMDGKEEDETDCDLPIAIMPRKKQVTLMQMDGNLSKADWKRVVDTNVKGCMELYEKQKQALRERWMAKNMKADE